MASELTKPFEEKMKKTLTALDSDYGTIRAGRANPHVLDKIMVEYYGTPTPLNQVGNITVPEPRLLQIQPWDASLLKAIEKAINMSELGINPNNDGKVIRLVFPELTEERRKELAKDVKKKGDAAKTAVRNIRRDANDSFKKLAKEDVSEDEIKQLEDQVQKMTYFMFRNLWQQYLDVFFCLEWLRQPSFCLLHMECENHIWNILKKNALKQSMVYLE